MFAVVFLAAAGFVVAQGAPAAQSVRTITLDECVTQAGGTSFSLQKSAIDLAASKTKAENLWAEFFPSISLGASVSFEDSLSKPLKSFPNDVAYQIPLTVSLTLQGDLPLTLKLAKLDYEIARLNWDKSVRDLRITVSKDFYSLLVEQENLTLLSETYDLAARQLAKSETQFRSGLTSELNLLRARLASETARFNLDKARRDWERKLQAFLSGAGFDIDNEKTISLSGELDTEPLRLDTDALLAAYLPQRAEVVRAQLSVERSKLTATQTGINRRGPQISLSGSIGGSLSDTLSGSNKTPLGANFRAQIGVTIPIDGWIPKTKTAQAVSAAKNEVEKARLDLAQAEETAKTAVRSIIENIENTLASIEIAKLRAQIAERAFDLAAAAFERGALERLEYENTRAAWDEARKSVLDAGLSYQNLILDLESALNTDIGSINAAGK